MPEYLLEIELQSAASPGSGEGWAQMIDSDIVHDEYGLPFIPARRVKGVLREMAEEVAHAVSQAGLQQEPAYGFTEKSIGALFGERGQTESSGLAVDNAYLPQHEKLQPWMEWAKWHVPHLATPENVITVFTDIRRQTKIENGVAKDTSLRQIRVLKRGLKFYSRVTLHSPALENLLQLAAGATKSFGGKRNRGLGKIRCKLKPAGANQNEPNNGPEAQNG